MALQLLPFSLTLTPMKLELPRLYFAFLLSCSCCAFHVAAECLSSSAFCSVVRPTCNLVLPGPSSRYTNLRQDKQVAVIIVHKWPC